MGDTLATGAASQATLALVDGSTHALAPDSRLQLNKVRFDPQQASNSQILLTLSEGVLFSQPGSVGASGMAPS